MPAAEIQSIQRGKAMHKLKLEIPEKIHEVMAGDFVREYIENNSPINGSSSLEKFDKYDDWLVKLKNDLDYDNILPGRVPASTYFLTRDGYIVGIINIRHRLNDFLLREGGHIGYSIRPTERRKGYATRMLKLGLQECIGLGMNRVLVTCDKNNIGSAKTIIRNGGVLENEITDSSLSDIVQRYWIDLV